MLRLGWMVLFGCFIAVPPIVTITVGLALQTAALLIFLLYCNVGDDKER